MANIRKNITFQQKDLLVSAMENDRELYAQRCNSVEGRSSYKAKWEELVTALNSVQGGSRKSVVEWQKAWTQYKNKVKGRASHLRAHTRGTGGGEPGRLLAPIELRVVAILGEETIAGLGTAEGGFRTEDPPSAVPLDPEVIIEEFEEPQEPVESEEGAPQMEEAHIDIGDEWQFAYGADEEPSNRVFLPIPRTSGPPAGTSAQVIRISPTTSSRPPSGATTSASATTPGSYAYGEPTPKKRKKAGGKRDMTLEKFAEILTRQTVAVEGLTATMAAWTPVVVKFGEWLDKQ